MEGFLGKDRAGARWGIILGELFPPFSAKLRKMANLPEEAKRRLFRKKPDATLRWAAVGSLPQFLADAVDPESSGEVGVRLPEVDVEALERSGEFIDRFSHIAEDSSRYPGLSYRGMNLMEVCRNPLMYVLAKAWTARRTISSALAHFMPQVVLVIRGFSLEDATVSHLLKDVHPPVRVEQFFPRWWSVWEARLRWLARCMWEIWAERKVRFESAMVEKASHDPGWRPSNGALVWFYSVGLTSTRATLPVMTEMVNRGKFPVRIAYRKEYKKEVEDFCRGEGCRLIPRAGLRPGRIRSLIWHGFRLGGLWRAIRSLGLDFCGLPLASILWDPPARFGGFSFGTVKAWADYWSREFSRESPTVMVTGNGRDWRARLVSEVIEKRGGQTVAVQDGVYYGGHPAHRCAAKAWNVVGGNVTRRCMVERGTPDERVLALGVPRYDRLIREKRKERAMVFRDLGLREDARLVLIATDHTVEIEGKRREVEAILRAAEEIAGAEVVFKLHPSEHDGIVARTVEAAGKSARFPIVQHYPIWDLLAAADVVVTRYSSAGAEAAALGKMVILLDLNGSSDYFSYVREGMAAGIYKSDDLAPMLRRLLEDQSLIHEMRRNGKRFLEEYLGPMDGRAAERTAAFVESLASRTISLARQ